MTSIAATLVASLSGVFNLRVLSSGMANDIGYFCGRAVQGVSGRVRWMRMLFEKGRYEVDTVCDSVSVQCRS